MKNLIFGLFVLAATMISCKSALEDPVIDSIEDVKIGFESRTIGEIIELDPALRNIVAKGAKIEVLADGFDWTEGPVWIEDGGYLLFSDVPANTIYKWKEGEGKSLYLKPSGYTGEVERSGEPGSNGLLLDADGNLVLCQHGDRRLARMEAPLEKPAAIFATLGKVYEEKRFNSPNDAAFHSNGDLYFTDPPYGLEGKMDDPTKEIPFQGVYRLTKDGEVILMTRELERPNGVALSKDETTLYVANSDSGNPVIMSYLLDDNGNVEEGKVLFDAKHLMKKGAKGLPDGLKVGKSGTLFATGPGGVLVLSSDGKHLGTISSGEATSNCALDTAEDYLYATSDMYLIRIKLKNL